MRVGRGCGGEGEQTRGRSWQWRTRRAFCCVPSAHLHVRASTPAPRGCRRSKSAPRTTPGCPRGRRAEAGRRRCACATRDAVTTGRAPGKAARRHLITAAASTNAAIATTRATVIATYMEAGAKPCRFASSGVQAHQPLPKLAANHNAASSVVVGRSDATQRPRTGRSAPPSLCGQPMARRGRRARSARSSLAGGSPTVPSPSQPSPPPRAATMRLCASADASVRLRGSSRVTPLPPALMLARTCAASPPLPAEMSQRGLSGSAKAAAASTAAAGSATRQR